MMLDFKDKIELPDDMKTKFFNELQTLDNIWWGMCFIYGLTETIEKKANREISDGTVLQNMPPDVRQCFEGKQIRYLSFGNDPALEWLDKGLLYSLFQWYAVSACNYVRLVDYLAKQINPEHQELVEYAKKVIPDVKWFRDKIAAHPARASNNKDKRDNEADRMGSVFYQVGFIGDRFRAPVWQVTVKKRGAEMFNKRSSLEHNRNAPEFG